MVEYTVKRSNRKTVSIVILPGGQVEVRCPYNMTNAQVRKIVVDKTPWIKEHLSSPTPAPTPDAGKFTEAQLHDFARQAKADLTMRVAYYAPRAGVTYGRITIRHQRTRWGSCSSKGNLNFNCLLILVPPHIRDYVVVHELCHRKQMNHSAKFWAEVEKILPDYRSRRDWLKKNGGSLIKQLP